MRKETSLYGLVSQQCSRSISAEPYESMTVMLSDDRSGTLRFLRVTAFANEPTNPNRHAERSRSIPAEPLLRTTVLLTEGRSETLRQAQGDGMWSAVGVLEPVILREPKNLRVTVREHDGTAHRQPLRDPSLPQGDGTWNAVGVSNPPC